MTHAKSRDATLLDMNRDAHDAIADKYDHKHTEIYNPREQSRLDAALGELVGMSGRIEPMALDVGAGTGNVALKLLRRGCHVTAMDVSAASLEVLTRKAQGSPKLETIQLTGPRFPFPDESFDIVTTYSVLHHVPDYLLAVAEMIRVAKPGGLVYIDHEAAPAAWVVPPDPHLVEYRRHCRLGVAAHLALLFRSGELFTADFLRGAFIKLFVNRRFEREGDIHVWPDDHIEWPRIYELFERDAVAIEVERDYLCYFPRGGSANYERYSRLCCDIRLVIGRKRG